MSCGSFMFDVGVWKNFIAASPCKKFKIANHRFLIHSTINFTIKRYQIALTRYINLHTSYKALIQIFQNSYLYAGIIKQVNAVCKYHLI